MTVEEGGLTSPFRNSIAWQSATSPLPMEHNPQVIFEKLFGDGTIRPSARRDEKNPGAFWIPFWTNLARSSETFRPGTEAG